MQSARTKSRTLELSSRVRFIAFLIFLSLLFLGGGGSRADIMSLLYVRPAAILCLTIILLSPGPIRYDVIKVPLGLLIALAALMILQLVPLPPALWTRLAGHELLASAATSAGMSQPWRPLSVAPDFTLNSLVSLVVPFAALIGMASLKWNHVRAMMLVIMGAALFSGLVGAIQLSAGPGSSFYIYDITNAGSAVGLFSNRNHQAALLALVFPMLAFWASFPSEKDQFGATRPWIAVAIGLFLFLMLIVSGSRAGVVLGGVGVISAIALGKLHAADKPRSRNRHFRMLSRYGPWVFAIILLAAAVMLSRAESLQRLFSGSTSEDLRLLNLPLLLQIAGDFMPTGAGFGTFDPVFRIYEPHESLTSRYLNHAHNDFIEVSITGGIAALILGAIFLGWWASKTYSVVRAPRIATVGIGYQRLGAIVIFMLLAESLVDYPLRTPIMAGVFAIACAWLAGLANRPTSEYAESSEGRASTLYDPRNGR